MIDAFVGFTFITLDALIVASGIYLAVRAAIWVRAWQRQRPRAPRRDPFLRHLEAVRRREVEQLTRSKGAAYCSECGFPLARKKAPACPFCAVAFEVAS